MVDLFVADAGQGLNTLYRNLGNGHFSRLSSSSVSQEGGFSVGTAWGDYDNDNRPDLFLANLGSNFLYHNDGGGAFTKVSGSAVGQAAGNSTSCAWADYDRDGFLDLFVANIAAVNALYHNNRDGTFTRVTNGAIVTDVGSSVSCAWADYDQDGYPDLFVANSGGEDNVLYHNDREGSFTRVTDGDVANDGGDSYCAAWGDLDNDGDLDLFVGNFLQNNFLYENNGDGTFSALQNTGAVTDGGGSLACAWGDLDNDGLLDLVVANVHPPQFLYQNVGNGTFRRMTNGVFVLDYSPSQGILPADYDDDGDLDLLVVKAEGQTSGLYQNSGNTNHWIKVRCRGIRSNRSAIGTVIRVKAQIRGVAQWQVRQIAGGQGTGEVSPEALFGLGDASQVDVIEVTWPTGSRQTYYRLTADQKLVIQEAPPLVADGPPGHLMVSDTAGSVYSLQSSADLETWVDLGRFTNETGLFQFQDPSPIDVTRFYRATYAP